MTDITLVLHNIRSTHNVGSIFRSAEGFGVKKIILTGYTPYPVIENDVRLPHISAKITNQIHKTALGAETMVPFEHWQDVSSWIETNDQSSNPLPLIALEQAASSIPISEYTLESPIALLLGEEVDGIQPELLSRCSSILEIPMVGKKESYNVSVATGIALYALTESSPHLRP